MFRTNYTNVRALKCRYIHFWLPIRSKPYTEKISYINCIELFHSLVFFLHILELVKKNTYLIVKNTKRSRICK